jgi:acetyl esterase/lipase
MKLALLLISLSASIASAEWIALWPKAAPGAKQPPKGSETLSSEGFISDVEIPQYQLYPAAKDKATGSAVVLLPGGGYGFDSMTSEGENCAKWFAERGITAITVKYRVSRRPEFGYQFPVPFLDARRAIRTVRAKATEWGVNPAKVGVVGASAGGHLASLCATRFADTFSEEGKDEIDALSCRPDFAVLLYPVISMEPPLTHGASRENLLGKDPKPKIAEKYSTQKAVTPATPPVFIVSTSDDWVDCRNSLDFASACKAQGVPVTLHLFEKGGHGYALGGDAELAAWASLLEPWLARR